MSIIGSAIFAHHSIDLYSISVSISCLGHLDRFHHFCTCQQLVGDRHDQLTYTASLSSVPLSGIDSITPFSMSVIGSAIFTHVCIDIVSVGSAVCHRFPINSTIFCVLCHSAIFAHHSIDLYSISVIGSAIFTPWGCINMGLYNMSQKQHGAVSAWGCIGV